MTSNNYIDRLVSLTKEYFKTYLGIAVSVVLFIQFFQPFVIERFNFENKLVFIGGFGLIIIASLMISQIIYQNPLIKARDELHTDSIYLPLYFFTQFIITTVAFVFYIRYVGQSHITFNTVVKVSFICLSLPVSINLKNKFASFHARIKKLNRESRSTEERLKNFSESYANKFIEMASDNDADKFRIQVNEIVFLKSADNYVEIGYMDEGAVKKKLIRNTLRNIEQQLGEFNNFVRTHRTSLVNIQFIQKLNKNFNTYWLSLEKTKDTIPVSRQYLLAVKDLL